MDNAASDHCMLCVDKFTYSNRRHHCRCCGTLCCAPCSTKRLRLQHDLKASSSGKVPAGERVCDGCFNRLNNEAVARNAAMAKAKKVLLLQLENDEKADLLHQSSNGSVTDVTLLSGESPSQSSGHHDQIDGLKEVLAGTGEALKERGEKLATTAEKSAKMEEVCNIYIY